MAVATVGFIPLLLVLTSGGLFSSGVLGLPPGERDAALVRCPPADVLLYVEWAERGPGQAGARGIDGLAADPEVRAFLAAAEQALVAGIEEATTGEGREAEVAGKHVPPLVKLLLNRSGCVFVSFDDKARPLEGGGGFPDPGLILMSGLRGTLVVNGGERADEIAKHLEALVELLPERERSGGLDRQKLPLPAPGMQLVLHRHEKHFLLGFGEGAIDQALAGLAGDAQGLAGNQRFQAVMKRLAVPRTAAVTWLDIKAALDKATAVLGGQGQIVRGMTRTLGLDALESVASVTGVEDGQVVTRSFVHTGGGTQGVLALSAGRGIRPADFNHVPADADLVFAFSLSQEKVLAAARQIISDAHPPSGERFEQVLEQLESELGFSFERDVFPAFGDVWTVYDSPGAGGVLLTSAVACLEVRDAAKAQQVFGQLMKILNQALPGDFASRFGRRGVYLEHQEFMGREVYYINTVGEEMPFAPAFCVTDKHVLVGPHPQALKAHLRFAANNADSFARKAAPANGPAGEVLCYTYTDARRAVQLFYAFVPFWGQMVYSEIQREGAKIDIFSLPSARAILPYVSESFSTCVRQPEGLFSESRRGLPVPGGAGLLLNLPLTFGMMIWRVSAAADFEAAPAIGVPINALPPQPQARPATEAAGESDRRVRRRVAASWGTADHAHLLLSLPSTLHAARAMIGSGQRWPQEHSRQNLSRPSGTVADGDRSRTRR